MRQSLAEKMRQLEQLEKREQLRSNKAKSARQKLDQRRSAIVGEIFLEIFPEFLNLKPQQTQQDNEREFRPLRDFLSNVAADRGPPKAMHITSKRTYEPSTYSHDEEAKRCE